MNSDEAEQARLRQSRRKEDREAGSWRGIFLYFTQERLTMGKRGADSRQGEAETKRNGIAGEVRRFDLCKGLCKKKGQITR